MVPAPIPVEEARAAVLAEAGPLCSELVPVEAAGGRVLARDVVAVGPVPPFPSSAMDGFAVLPGPAGRRLVIVGESRAGRPAERPPGEDEALRISTGAAVPTGAAVIPVEETDERNDAVELRTGVAPGARVRPAGDDMPGGQAVLRAGATLGAAALGVAVSAGAAEVACARRPRVTVLCTGDELRPPGARLGPGEIHNSNAIVLATLAARSGAHVVETVLVPDDPAATRDALARALSASDVVLASGGVSVGVHDHVKPALAALGVSERFWRVALKPGKPTWFGVRERPRRTLVFGLPGNPVSSIATFVLFARPVLAALQGAPPAPRGSAVLAEALAQLPGRTHAVRVRLRARDGLLEASATGPQGSHQLTSMLGADALALVPPGRGELSPGAPVALEIL